MVVKKAATSRWAGWPGQIFDALSWLGPFIEDVYVEGTEVGWFDGARRNVRTHSDRGTAVADFIQRLTAWLARQEVLEVDG